MSVEFGKQTLLIVSSMVVAQQQIHPGLMQGVRTLGWREEAGYRQQRHRCDLAGNIGDDPRDAISSQQGDARATRNADGGGKGSSLARQFAQRQ